MPQATAPHIAGYLKTILKQLATQMASQRVPSPTPKQIRERCQEIQRSWTSELERQRRADPQVTEEPAWSPPELSPAPAEQQDSAAE